MKKLSILLVLNVLFFAGFGASGASAQKKTVKKKAAASKLDWRGMWSVPSRFAGGTLTVLSVSAGKFTFQLDAINGANMGTLEGFAVIKGAKAFFDDRAQTGRKTDKVGCLLTFTHKGAYIDIKQSKECDYYAGNAVMFEGEFHKNTMVLREENFVDLNVFPDKAVDWKFRELVDRDYENFLNSFHLITEEENLDPFGAKVFSACVRGVCPYNAGIIMYNELGQFWAAVVFAAGEQKVFINYYSNVPEWTGKMPKTIEKWAKEKESLNENVTVNFKSIEN